MPFLQSKGVKVIALLSMPRHLRVFCLLSFVLFYAASYGQTREQNFIISRTYKKSSLTVSGNIYTATQEVNYVDGLGRPLQAVSGQGSPLLSGGTPKDLATQMEYDASGRLIKTYLPTPFDGSGSLKSGVSGASNDYYYNGANVCVPISGRGFSETQYEASPLNRVVKQYAGGTDRAVSFTYKVNNGGEVKNYTATENSLGQSGNYGDGQLTYVETLDENSNKTQEFKDKAGRVVLRRAFTSTEQFDTYYVYNDLSQLRYVLQPQFQSEGLEDKYAFRYEYNERGLVKRKYVPGGGWTGLTYDERDRLKESKDAAGRTIYYEYDALNRVIETGELVGTTKNPLTTTAYDTYSANASDFVNVGDNYPGSSRSDAKGYVTVTGARVIKSDGTYEGWLYTTIRYNDRYQVIQTIRNLYDLNGREIVTRDLRFDGQVLREQTRQELASGTHQVDKIYAYDHNDRVLGIQYVVKKNGAEKKKVDIAANRYDGIGQLKTKHLHSGLRDNNYIEKLEYCYTPRGWLSSVTGQKSSGTNYGLDLKYSNPTSGGLAQYNGNIAEMYWRRNGSESAGYRFEYDGLNRLKHANGIGVNQYSEKEISYDKNGNLLTLQRWNSSNMWDNLSYNYDGNRLKTVSDNGSNSLGFQKRLNIGGDDYYYDANGNATRDLNRNINTDGLRYNVLNLIRQAAVTNGPTVSYHYDGGGNKLRMDTGTPNTKYAGGFEYNQSNDLTRIAMEEGQIIVSGESYEFQYYLRDHLGNTRMVLNEAGTTIQETEYFPFGMPIPTGGTETANKYLYNGKEKQPGTEYLDFKWRQYDPAVARFFSVDRLSEKFTELTPYQFASNDPVAKIELDGLEGVRYQDLSEKNRYVYAGPVGGTGNDRIGVSGKASVGFQAGIVEKRFGVGVGYYVNAGSIDVGGLQLDLLDGVKTTDMADVSAGKGKFNFTTGGEIQFGAIGLEFENEKAFKGLNNFDQTVSVGLSIGGFKFSYIDQGAYSRSGRNDYFKVKDESKKSDVTVTFGESKSLKAVGLKVEGKAEVTMSLTFGKFIDKTPWVMRQDNTKHQPVKLLPAVY